MSKLKTFFSLIKNPQKMIVPLDANHLLTWMSDETFSRLAFRGEMGYPLNLQHPETFNEKLQWLKINDHRPEYTGLVDKLKAKEIVGQMIGKEHIVPVYGDWKTADDIPFSELPDQFVLKCNHDQGSVILVKNKNTLDTSEVIRTLNKKLKRNTFYGTREYPYKDIEPRVFAEEYLQDDIIDYKFYCFQGEPQFLYCGMNMIGAHHGQVDFFDLDWNPMPFYRTDYDRLGSIPKPACLNELIDIARKLSKNVPFVRIDLFAIDNTIYFSEFTLCPASGFMRFVPEEYDRIIGKLLKLPVKRCEK